MTTPSGCPNPVLPNAEARNLFLTQFQGSAGRLAQCWLLQDCHSCINSKQQCGWCPMVSCLIFQVSQSCVIRIGFNLHDIPCLGEAFKEEDQHGHLHMPIGIYLSTNCPISYHFLHRSLMGQYLPSSNNRNPRLTQYQSSTCLPLPLHSSLPVLLRPLTHPDICPLSQERYELRTHALGCAVSTITLLTCIITVLSTLLAILLIWGVWDALWYIVHSWRASRGGWAMYRRADGQEFREEIWVRKGRSWAQWAREWRVWFLRGKGEGEAMDGDRAPLLG